MKVLVTGATGFVGRAIVSELNAAGEEVVAIGSPRPSLSGHEIETQTFIRADIANSDELNDLKTIENVEIVIHSAGLVHQFGDVSKHDFFNVNVGGTANICELAAALSVKKFLLISSVSVYGNSFGSVTGIDENFECNPKGNYAESKFESENIARKICEANGISLTILRPATVVGEGDAGNVLRLIRSIDRRSFIWLGKGENSKSLLYKKDLARACLMVLKSPVKDVDLKTEVFNVSAKPLKMRTLVKIIEDSLGKKNARVFFPENIARKVLMPFLRVSRIPKFLKLNDSIEKWFSNDVYNADKIKKSFGFDPKTSIEDALVREVNWYLKK